MLYLKIHSNVTLSVLVVHEVMVMVEDAVAGVISSSGPDEPFPLMTVLML